MFEFCAARSVSDAKVKITFVVDASDECDELQVTVGVTKKKDWKR